MRPQTIELWEFGLYSKSEGIIERNDFFFYRGKSEIRKL